MPSNANNPPPQIEPDHIVEPIVQPDNVKSPTDPSSSSHNVSPVHRQHTPMSPAVTRLSQRVSNCPAFFSSKLGIAVMLGIFLIVVGSIWGFVPFPQNRDIPRPGGIAVLLLGVLLITTLTTPKLYFAEHPKPGHSFNYLRSASGSVASGLDRPLSRMGSAIPPTSSSRRPSQTGGPTLIPNAGSELRSRSPSPMPGTPTHHGQRTVIIACTAKEWIQHSDAPPSYNSLHCV